MANFEPEYPIDGLVGADYNPRRIEDDTLEALRHSIATLGVCKPLIVSGKLIVAGHQRTKALRSIGRTTAPAVVLKDVAIEDEIRFNQLHNGTDFDSGDEQCSVGLAGCPPFSFEDVPSDRISGNMRARMVNVRLAICNLIESYGTWGACVATVSGKVLHAAQYALACRAIGVPVRVYRIPDEIEGEARRLLGRKYGVFSYDHIERKTYIQTFAQMYRLRDTDTGRQQKSALYEERVKPEIKPGERILDFGCGQGDYVKALAAAGMNILGIEFFYRNGRSIDGGAVHRMIDFAVRDVTRHGLFDVVVCDSVLNSVDSPQAEADVLTCVNALCRMGGRIYLSGRRLERLDAQDRMTVSVRKKHSRSRYVEFVDGQGFTAIYRNGNWFFQKFHREDEVRRLVRSYIGTDPADMGHSSTAWTVGATKTIELPDEVVREAIGREFDLPWPGNRSVSRGRQMLAAWDAVRTGPRQTASCGMS